MTNASPFARRTPASPTLPRGDVLGTYDSYPEAQKVVNTLAKADFPVKQISIVGNDLKTVERVTGRLTYARAALAGAASGAWFGLFIGLLLVLFSPEPNFSFILAAALIGAAFGLLFSVVTYAAGRRRRDFTTTHQVLASNYQLIIDPQLTGRARAVLAGERDSGASPSTPAPVSAEWPPPQAPADTDDAGRRPS
ncbi:hypothetical protein OVN20_13030 [Microcella daejeonensis]|uniref:general stress protein n=1 Tax=Microcella daejeonensis TaxID=2994971 RepID=UPI00227020BE|nr:general stress protein [Microcella daejeonensis]WAB83934.1 hypothetical protein OVN20_13030 [Microcella daejeonensis]